MCIRFAWLIMALLAVSCGASPESQKKDSGPPEPAVAEDGRWILSLSDRGFFAKGVPVQVGRTTLAELEKAFATSARVVDPVGLGGSRRYGIWDGQGIKVHFSISSGRIDYFDCVFESILIPELSPSTPFNCVLKVDGAEVGKNSVKESLQQRMQVKLIDRKDSLPGFTATLGGHLVDFNLSRERRELQYIRISPAKM